ncbi:BTAD domain-containing putative transcriptional regulator [Nocardioides aestuarii]|uniref:BTAD domain-containing putative transcriptional regulator n=1 Tax=Nocardioides aestuarii TaxID=252231 RepID=A0ABW4TLX5_9ACTN
MRIQVLGSTRAEVEPGEHVALGSRRPRSILAALALTPGQVVSADALADLLWGGQPPPGAHGTLHSHLSGLRRSLEPGLARRDPGNVIATTDHGYVLRVPRDHVDTHVFADVVAAAERQLASLWTLVEGPAVGAAGPLPAADEVTAAVERLDEALATWEGTPYADLPDHGLVAAERSTLERLRTAAEEARLVGLLALGDHLSVLARTEATTSQGVLSERTWGLHAVALARAGRQADALDAVRQVRELLADELGIDPGPGLQWLETAILRQVPELATTLTTRTAVDASGPAPALPAAAGTAGPVGRAAERGRLADLLDTAAGGRLALGHVVGEPGIGKSHLLGDLVGRAHDAGFRVAVGRCSQDDGAPPLWPWRSVLADLGSEVGPAGSNAADSDGHAAFETWDRIARAVGAAAVDAPVLVVLDDLHWADESTLRALAHLLSTAPDGTRLAVVVARRSHPEPAGPLAAVADALARRDAVRLDLTGLDPSEAADLVADHLAGAVDPTLVERWQERASGNPFFLIELARLGASADVAVPVTVRDAVTQRLTGLRPDLLEVVRTAAVAGREFDAATVAAADDLDADEVLELLEEAAGAGVVVERGPEHFGFAHALVRDAVVASLPASRVARRHARLARALAQPRVAARHDPQELVAERARHWIAAGPSHADVAWRAADEAAAQARRLSSWTEAMRLRESAIAAHRSAVSSEAADRYRLLVDLATDAAHAAQWPGVEQAVIEAVRLGRELGSPELVADAITDLTRYCVWTPHDIGVVFHDLVDDLRWAVAELEPGSPGTRARLDLGLAVELIAVDGAEAERHALVESGLALARGTGDASLLAWATRAAWLVAWAPGRTTERLAWVEEGAEAARAAGDPVGEAVLLLAAAVDHLELADREAWEGLVGRAEELGTRHRLPYVLIVVRWLQYCLALLRDDESLVAERLDALMRTVPEVAIPSQDMQVPFAHVWARVWGPREGLAEVTDAIVAAQEAWGNAETATHLVLARAGDPRLGEVLRRWPARLGVESWETLADWCWEAEAAHSVGDRQLAATAVEVLSRYDDRMSLSGAAIVVGPVAGYLALAHAATGEREASERHRATALAMATEWDLTRYVDWLERALGT